MQLSTTPRLLAPLALTGLLAACGGTTTPQDHTAALQSALGGLEAESQRHADAVATAPDLEHARAEEQEHRDSLHPHWDQADRVITDLAACLGDYESMGPGMGSMHDGSRMEAMHADMDTLHDRLYELDALMLHHEEVWAQAGDLDTLRAGEAEHHRQVGALLDEMVAATHDLSSGDPEWEGWDCGHMATERHHDDGGWGHHSGRMGGYAR